MEAETSHLSILNCTACKGNHEGVPIVTEDDEELFVCPTNQLRVILAVDDSLQEEGLAAVNEQRLKAMAMNYRALEDRVLQVEAFIETTYDPKMRN